MADARYAVGAVLVGLGATVVMDLWALFLRRAFNIRSLDLCLLGRWVLHLLDGTIAHQNIGASADKPHECAVGWTAHYSIGAAFALLFILLASGRWLEQPTLVPALGFGVVTTLVPFLTMQPAFGLGVAASKTPHPTRARLKSLMTHAIFGAGLYLGALLVRRVLFQA